MIIQSIKCYLLSSPYGGGNVLGQPLGVKTVAIIELRTSSGHVGFGEAYVGIYTPELVDAITIEIESRLIGRRVEDILDHKNRLFIPFISRNGLFASVYGAVELCLLDVLAKSHDIPMWKVLSETPNFDLKFYLSAGSAALSPDEITDELKGLDQFYDGYKMRIGYQTWAVDKERIMNAKNNIGSKCLMLDAIMGSLRPAWTIQDLKEKSKFLESINPLWIEEPFDPDDYDSYKSVSKIKLPIAFGEALVGKFEFIHFIKSFNLTFMQMDATHMGGIGLAKELVKGFEGDLPDLATHTWGSTVGFMANLHMAIALNKFKWIEVPGVELDLSSKMGLPSFISICKNYKEFSEKPGLGIDLNLEELAKLFPFKNGSGFRL